MPCDDLRWDPLKISTDGALHVYAMIKGTDVYLYSVQIHLALYSTNVFVLETLFTQRSLLSMTSGVRLHAEAAWREDKHKTEDLRVYSSFVIDGSVSTSMLEWYLLPMLQRVFPKAGRWTCCFIGCYDVQWWEFIHSDWCLISGNWQSYTA